MLSTSCIRERLSTLKLMWLILRRALHLHRSRKGGLVVHSVVQSFEIIFNTVTRLFLLTCQLIRRREKQTNSIYLTNCSILGCAQWSAPHSCGCTFGATSYGSNSLDGCYTPCLRVLPWTIIPHQHALFTRVGITTTHRLFTLKVCTKYILTRLC